MKTIRILLFALTVVSLTGCKSLYGKYHRPEVTTDGLLRDVTSLTDTLANDGQQSFGQLPWRQVFTDPQLQALIEQGLTNNTDLLNAALNVKMIESQLTAAKLAFVPGFTFTPQGTIASWDGAKPTKTYSLPVNASWSIDLFGNLLSQKRAVQMQLLQMKDYQVSVQTAIVANVANMYYTLLMLDRQLEVVTDMERLTKDTWDIMQLRKNTTIGIRSTAVQSAEANYLSVQTQKTDLKRQIREVENSLSLLIGQQAQTISRGRLDDQQLPQQFSAGVGIDLLANRADVHANEMALAQCFHNVQTARSRFYPSITINASGAYTNNSGAGIVNPGKILASAVGSLTQPIFQHGLLVAGLKVAKAQYDQAYNTWQQSILKAGSEVSNALVQYNASAEKAALEQQRIKVLRQNVEDTRLLMASAGSTYLEVITAEQSLLNAELNAISNQFSKMQAVVDLYNALGGGSR